MTRVQTIGGSSSIKTHECHGRRHGTPTAATGRRQLRTGPHPRAYPTCGGLVPNIHRRRVVTFVVTSASNAPRTPRAPRTNDVFLFASLSFAMARCLPTAGRVERMAQSSSARVSGPVLQGLRGRPDPVAPPLDSRGEFARAFTSPLRRAFRTCEPRQLRRADRGLRA